MQQLATPANLRYAASANARQSNSLAIAFDTVPNATEYLIWIDGVQGRLVAPVDTLTGLSPNLSYSIQVQARAAGFQDSSLSAPLDGLTRPPTPQTLARLPSDLQSWGICLVWNEAVGWNGANLAHVTLERSDAGGAFSVLTNRLALTDRYVDIKYPFDVVKSYQLIISVPLAGAATVNESSPSSPLQAIRQFGMIPDIFRRTQLNRDVERHRRFGDRLLGFPFRH
jgi:hypothetical protein